MSVRKKASLSKRIVLAVTASVALTMILLVPVAMLVHKQLLPQNAGPATTAIVSFAALCFSIIAFFGKRKNIFPAAGITLGCYLFMFFITGLCICGDDILGMNLVWHVASAVVGSLMGIMVATGKRTKRKGRGKR